MTTTLRPARARLSKYWSTKKNVSSEYSWTPADWANSDLSTVVRLAGAQMSAIGRPFSRRSTMDRTEAKRIESALEQRYSTYSLETAPVVWEDGPPASAPIAPPNRAPPPPPIAELESPTDGDRFTITSPLVIQCAELPAPPAVPSVQRPRPISGIRRRAKTPVHTIGQLEKAARDKEIAALNHKSSADSLADHYRGLASAPELPQIDTTLHRTLSRPVTRRPVISEKDDTTLVQRRLSRPIVRRPVTPENCRSSPQISPTPDSGIFLDADEGRSRVAPSPVSDDGTLVSYDDDHVHCKPSWSSPTVSLSTEVQIEEEVDATYKTPAPPQSLRFQIGLELLRGELGSALSEQSSRSGRDAAGLQIWVMIEAYERLRDQIANTAMQTKEHQDAAAMFDNWLNTLYSIQQSMAYDAAQSESEYEED